MIKKSLPRKRGRDKKQKKGMINIKKNNKNRKNNIKKYKSKLIPVSIKYHRDKNGGHPHIIVDNIDENHVSVGLSTKLKKGKGGNATNYTMSKSPLDDGKNSYMRRQGTVAPVNTYYRSRQGTMISKDYNQAKIYGERAKQKYLERKNKKR